MITLSLRPYRQGRVWLNEMPNLHYAVAEIIECTLPAADSSIHEVRRAAIELCLPKGGRAFYGLLGAEFTPVACGSLTVRMAVSVDNEPAIDWALAASLDQVYAGIPYEYVDAVFVEACGPEAVDVLGSGVLRFCWGAYGLIGSSNSR